MKVPASSAFAIAALSGALVLVACKKQVAEDPGAASTSVAGKMSGADARPQPGRWESTLKLESFDMPGMPPEAKAMMAKSVGTARTLVTCLSAEDAARPAADFFHQGKSGCTYDNFSMEEGRIDGAMTCKEGPGRLKIALAGTYAPDRYEVHTTSSMKMPDGNDMTQTMTMTSHRTGECKGDELNTKKN